MTSATTHNSVIAKRIMEADAEATVQAGTPSWPVAEISSASDVRVVQLFVGTSTSADTPLEVMADEARCAATIGLVRTTAVRVCALQRHAHTIAQNAQELASTATAGAQAAEERARCAEAIIETTLVRLEQAEKEACVLQKKIEAANTRTSTAELKAGEALSWLQQMNESVAGEFSTLTIRPLSDQTR